MFMLEMPPPPDVQTRLLNGRVAYRVNCPWCTDELDWCISWIAAWAELVQHYGKSHRAVQDALKGSL